MVTNIVSVLCCAELNTKAVMSDAEIKCSVSHLGLTGTDRKKKPCDFLSALTRDRRSVARHQCMKRALRCHYQGTIWR